MTFIRSVILKGHDEKGNIPQQCLALVMKVKRPSRAKHDPEKLGSDGGYGGGGRETSGNLIHLLSHRQTNEKCFHQNLFRTISVSTTLGTPVHSPLLHLSSAVASWLE